MLITIIYTIGIKYAIMICMNTTVSCSSKYKEVMSKMSVHVLKMIATAPMTVIATSGK